MRIRKLTRSLGVLFASACLGLCGANSKASGASAEQHFDTITIGTQTYSNVTVTTKNKSYVFLLHSAGMLNVKVSELTQEEKEILGYEARKPATNAAVAWAKTTIQKIESPQIRNIHQNLQKGAAPDMAKWMSKSLGLPVLIGFGVAMLAFYLFICYCCMLICKKTGNEPGALIWFPVLQMFPLLKAAGMSPVWFVAMLLPILNLVAHIVWCFKISQARGKSIWTAICLLLPVTSIFAFFYLAFSNGSNSQESVKERIEIMTLETA